MQTLARCCSKQIKRNPRSHNAQTTNNKTRSYNARTTNNKRSNTTYFWCSECSRPIRGFIARNRLPKRFGNKCSCDASSVFMRARCRGASKHAGQFSNTTGYRRRAAYSRRSRSRMYIIGRITRRSPSLNNRIARVDVGTRTVLPATGERSLRGVLENLEATRHINNATWPREFRVNLHVLSLQDILSNS